MTGLIDQAVDQSLPEAAVRVAHRTGHGSSEMGAAAVLKSNFNTRSQRARRDECGLEPNFQADSALPLIAKHQ
jgi:hypothetical protein